MRKADQVDLHVAEQLRRRRRLLNLAQREVAVGCGVRFQQIQKYEAGATRISAGRLWQLAEALDVPVAYFFEGLQRHEAANQVVDPQPPAPRRRNA